MEQVLSVLYGGCGIAASALYVPQILKYHRDREARLSISILSWSGWIAIAAVTRYSSLSGLVACAVAPAVLWALGSSSEATLFFVMAVLVFVMHRGNISRLMTGTETKIGRSAVKP